MGRIYTLSGPSGVGKTTFLSALLAATSHELRLIPRYTDRPRRPDEVDGFEYHFTSHTGLLQKVFANDFIHFDKWGDYYSAIESFATEHVLASDYDAVVLTSVFGAARLQASYGVAVVPLYLWTSNAASLRNPRCLNDDSPETEELKWRILKKRNEDGYSEFETADLPAEQFLAGRMIDNRLDLAAVNGRLRSGEHIRVIANPHNNLAAAIDRFSTIRESLPLLRSVNSAKRGSGCFVLMPFREGLLPVYDNHIVPACESAGLTVTRADRIFSVRPVMDDILESVSTSRFVIADLTDHNPNVFYEIGLCHALGKEVILISQSDAVPFDVTHIRRINYSETAEGLGRLRVSLENTLRTLICE